jgi:penicillin-binding protein 1A
VVTAVLGYGAHVVERALATLPPLADPARNLGESSVIYDLAGQPVAVVPGLVDRQPVPLSDIPPLVQHAFIAVEDRRFYQNSGIDLRGILRAAVADLTGHPLQGGSTITQQLARNMYLTQRDTLTRKVREAILAIELTRRYTKPEILDMYLNWIYLGEHAYGVQAAAETYFGVPVWRLTLPEAALLAGLPQEPVGYDPYYHPALALERRNTVLAVMAQQGYITWAQARAAMAAPLGVRPRPAGSGTVPSYPYPWFVDAVIEQLENVYHLSPQEVSEGGLRIYTTLVPRIQDAAQAAVDALDRTFPLDVPNPLEAAVAVIDQSNGDVVAVVGGRQHTAMLAFDRALQAERQPGSAIKPLVDYIPALEDGLTAGTVVDDRVVAFPNGPGQPAYVPTDYELPYYGLTTLTEALRRSVNTVAVQVLSYVGLQQGFENAVRMGLPLTKADLHLALALGGTTDCCTALDMARAYATIANGGARVRPRFIIKVVAPNGTVLVDDPPHITQVIDPRIAYVMTRMLMTVDEPQPPNGWDANWGTGFDATVQDDVPGWPTAAKTGTTNNDEDAWYVGFTPLYTAAVWIGYDIPKPFPGLFGGVYAGPIFRATMEAALAPYRPIPFRRPPGVVQALIDVKAPPWTVAKPSPLTPPQWIREEWFVAGTQPTHENPLWIRVLVDSADPGTVWEPGCPGYPVPRVFLNRPRLGRAWAEVVARALGGSWQQYVPADMALAPPTRACNGGTVSYPQVNDSWNLAPRPGEGGPTVPLILNPLTASTTPAAPASPAAAPAPTAGALPTSPPPARPPAGAPGQVCRSDWHVVLADGRAPRPAALCVPLGVPAFITFTAVDGRVHDVLLSGYGQEAVVPANGAPVTVAFTPTDPGAFVFQDALDPRETGTLTVRASG